jgi:hypothetical protein
MSAIVWKSLEKSGKSGKVWKSAETRPSSQSDRTDARVFWKFLEISGFFWKFSAARSVASSFLVEVFLILS